MIRIAYVFLIFLLSDPCSVAFSQTLKKPATVYFYRISKEGTTPEPLKLKINDTLTVRIKENSYYKLEYASQLLRLRLADIKSPEDVVKIKSGEVYYFRYEYFPDRIDIQQVGTKEGMQEIQGLEAAQKPPKPAEVVAHPTVKVTSIASFPGHYPGKVFIYIYRPDSRAGSVIPIRVMLPDSSILLVHNNSSYAVEAKPGDFKLVTVQPDSVHKNASLNLHVGKGNNYYIHLGFEKFAEIEMNMTDEETARLVMGQ